MAKLWRVVAACLLVLSLLAGCASGDDTLASSTAQQQAVPGGELASEGAQIALFITEEQKAQNFGQSVWSAINRFSGEEGVTYGAYTVDDTDTDATLQTVELAIKGAAEVVVAMGDDMAGIVERAQVLYPDLQYILLDLDGTASLRNNAVQLEYDEVQAGWLAGYAAVLEGARTLAYVEGEEADAAVQQRARGFVLGAEEAAADLGLEPGSVEVQDVDFDGMENAAGRREAIGSLYESGVELLFASDTAVQNDALRVSRALETKLIGLDLSFAADGAAPVASVVKLAGQPLYNLLAEWKQDNFPADRVFTCGLEHEGYALESSGFDRFTQTQYSTLVAKFSGGSLAAALQTAVYDTVGHLVAAEDLGTVYVRLAEPERDADTGRFVPRPPAEGDDEEDGGDAATGAEDADGTGDVEQDGVDADGSTSESQAQSGDDTTVSPAASSGTGSAAPSVESE